MSSPPHARIFRTRRPASLPESILDPTKCSTPHTPIPPPSCPSFISRFGVRAAAGGRWCSGAAFLQRALCAPLNLSFVAAVEGREWEGEGAHFWLCLSRFWFLRILVFHLLAGSWVWPWRSLSPSGPLGSSGSESMYFDCPIIIFSYLLEREPIHSCRLCELSLFPPWRHLSPRARVLLLGGSGAALSLLRRALSAPPKLFVDILFSVSRRK